MTQDRSLQRKTWKKEISAGGIVYKEQDRRVFVLLILPAKREDIKTGKFVPTWTFPKGWVGDHGDETIEESALREVREEGGVDARIVASLGEAKYFFRREGENIFKAVNYFLMEYISGDTADHDHEVTEAKWFELAEAEKALIYKTDKEVFERAMEKLRK